MTDSIIVEQAEWLVAAGLAFRVNVDEPEWLGWGGGKGPPEGDVVEVRLRNGQTRDGHILPFVRWDHRPDSADAQAHDIVAYRLAAKAEPDPVVVPDGGVTGDEPDGPSEFEACKAWLRGQAGLEAEGALDDVVWHPKDPAMHCKLVADVGIAAMAAMVTGADPGAAAEVAFSQFLAMDDRVAFVDTDDDDDDDFTGPPRVFIASEHQRRDRDDDSNLFEATVTHVVEVDGTWEALDGSGRHHPGGVYAPGAVFVLHQ